MPATKKQVKQQRLKIRAENQEETPMRRIRAAKSLLLLSNFTRDPSRLARRIANLFITSGEASEDVRAAAAKLLEIVSSHAVNDSEPDEDEVQIPTQYQIKRPKVKKAFTTEQLRNGDDLVGHFFEVLSPGDPGFPTRTSDFHVAKIRAREILLESGRLANRTEREEVLEEFRELTRQILMDPSFRDERARVYDELDELRVIDRNFESVRILARTCILCSHGDRRHTHNCSEHQMDPAWAARVMQQAESSATPLASPSQDSYGVEKSTTREQIKVRPELSIPPEILPGQNMPPIGVNCRICQSSDRGLALIAHNCHDWQNGATP